MVPRSGENRKNTATANIRDPGALSKYLRGIDSPVGVMELEAISNINYRYVLPVLLSGTGMAPTGVLSWIDARCTIIKPLINEAEPRKDGRGEHGSAKYPEWDPVGSENGFVAQRLSGPVASRISISGL